MQVSVNTPHFQETKNAGMCGPAVLKIVLDYFETPMTESELAVLCGTDAKKGTTGDRLVAVAQLLGFKATVKDRASFKDIEKALRAGVPPIVDWFTAEGGLADGHYSVVCGLTETHIVLEDPEIGKRRTLARDDFMRVWFDFDTEFLHTPSDILIRRLIIVQPK